MDRLTKRLRRQIEWHFKNYKADALLYDEQVDDIIDSGLTAKYTNIGSNSCGVSCPTEKKGIQILELDYERTWSAVVRNTFIAFRFKPEYSVMVEFYINCKPIKDILCDGIWENTFYRWRDNWLEFAYKWAKKFKLL